MIEVKGITIDKKWKWIAKDEDGRVYVYENMPKMSEQGWYGTSAALPCVRIIGLSNIHWDQSLHEIRHTVDGIILIPSWKPSFIVDDPVMVKNFDDEQWMCRHFARWGVRGELLTWEYGTTSFTSQHGFTAKWNYYRLPTPEELNRNANHK